VEGMRETQAINATRYKRLLSKAMPMIIETEEENERMLAEVEKLFDKGEDLSPEEEKVFKLMVKLIEDFEEKAYPIKNPTPLAMLEHLMDARGLTQKDLWDVFGSKSTASQVLNGKRALSKAHIKKLAAFFNLSPELFL
jgi:HTH-type transcriptional regulator/antitoxin HigA